MNARVMRSIGIGAMCSLVAIVSCSETPTETSEFVGPVKSEGAANATALNVDVDIAPMACPNVFSTHAQFRKKKKAVKKSVHGQAIRVAILGSASLDVRNIDASTLALAGVHGTEFRFGKAGAPSTGDCSGGQDEYEDLIFLVNKNRFVFAVDPRPSTTRHYAVTAALVDGTTLEGGDVIRWVPNNGPRKKKAK